MSDFTRPLGLNHVAYLTRDTARTVELYTHVLGLELVGHAIDDKVSVGESHRFLHTFFEMADGSCVAFFELQGLADQPDQTVVPPWVRHLALSVDSEEALEQARQRIVAAGFDVVGPIDHEGIWLSIYFFEHNGIRLELTYQRRPLDEHDATAAAAAVAEWVAAS